MTNTLIKALEDISERNVHDEKDEKLMAYVLNDVFKIQNRVVCGMVYAKGIAQPEPIGKAAKQAINALNQILDMKRKEGIIQ